MFLFGKWSDSSSTAPVTGKSTPVAIEAGPAGVNQITAQDKDAALTQFRKQLEAMQADANRGKLSGSKRIKSAISNCVRCNSKTMPKRGR